jgi:hypothetical protein
MTQKGEVDSAVIILGFCAVYHTFYYTSNTSRPPVIDKILAASVTRLVYPHAPWFTIYLYSPETSEHSDNESLIPFD